MVAFFLNLEKDRIIERSCHLHPTVDWKFLYDVLAFRPRYFRWAGADLINVVTEKGTRTMVVIENNSCPSGQKSIPLLDDHQEMGGYLRLIEDTFMPTLKGQRLIRMACSLSCMTKTPSRLPVMPRQSPTWPGNRSIISISQNPVIGIPPMG